MNTAYPGVMNIDGDCSDVKLNPLISLPFFLKE